MTIYFSNSRSNVSHEQLAVASDYTAWVAGRLATAAANGKLASDGALYSGDPVVLSMRTSPEGQTRVVGQTKRGIFTNIYELNDQGVLEIRDLEVGHSGGDVSNGAFIARSEPTVREVDRDGLEALQALANQLQQTQ